MLCLWRRRFTFITQNPMWLRLFYATGELHQYLFKAFQEDLIFFTIEINIIWWLNNWIQALINSLKTVRYHLHFYLLNNRISLSNEFHTPGSTNRREITFDFHLKNRYMKYLQKTLNRLFEGLIKNIFLIFLLCNDIPHRIHDISQNIIL